MRIDSRRTGRTHRAPGWALILIGISAALCAMPGARASVTAGPGGAAGALTVADGTAGETEIREVLDVIAAWNGAFARNDVPKYFSFIDDAITVLTPSNPYRVEGVARDRQEFEQMLRLGAGRVGYFQELQPRVQRFGDVAVVTYHSRGSYGPEGKERTLYLKETDVLVKRAEGWKVVHIHVSSTQGS
jgi:ketosteroid isomerase-like protein